MQACCKLTRFPECILTRFSACRSLGTWAAGLNSSTEVLQIREQPDPGPAVPPRCTALPCTCCGSRFSGGTCTSAAVSRRRARTDSDRRAGRGWLSLSRRSPELPVLRRQPPAVKRFCWMLLVTATGPSQSSAGPCRAALQRYGCALTCSRRAPDVRSIQRKPPWEDFVRPIML